MNYWLLKSEPDVYGLDDLKDDSKISFDILGEVRAGARVYRVYLVALIEMHRLGGL